MNLAEFVERYIEGYLFSDLHSMASIPMPPGQSAGAVGYPMVATALAGIELLGALTSPTRFDVTKGKPYFLEFWGRIYPDERKRLGTPVYLLARHGLAHSFVAKPLIDVYKYAGNPLHLQRVPDTGALIIDAAVLASDLRQAYDAHVKPHLTGPQGIAMQARVGEMGDDYLKQSEKHRLTIVQATQPADFEEFFRFITSGTPPSGATFVNSPAPGASHTQGRLRSAQIQMSGKMGPAKKRSARGRQPAKRP